MRSPLARTGLLGLALSLASLATTSASAGNSPQVSPEVGSGLSAYPASYATCGGTAPLQNACTAFGVLEHDGTIACAPRLGYTGSITAQVTTPNGGYSYSCQFLAGDLVSSTPVTQTGQPEFGDPYTLTGTASGYGGWAVYLNM